MKKTVQTERINNPNQKTSPAILHTKRYLWADKFAKDKKVLDISCGIGFGTYFLATKGQAKQVIGADNSKPTLKIAKKKYNHPNINFVYLDANKKLPFKDNTFDMVVSFETIEHLKNYELFIMEIRRILKKNGFLFISTPNKLFQSPLGKKPVNPYHIKEWHPREFYQFLSQHLFKVEKFKQEHIKKKTQRVIQTFIHRQLIQIFFDSFDPKRKGAFYQTVTRIWKIFYHDQKSNISYWKKIYQVTPLRNNDVPLWLLAKCKK